MDLWFVSFDFGFRVLIQHTGTVSFELDTGTVSHRLNKRPLRESHICDLHHQRNVDRSGNDASDPSHLVCQATFVELGGGGEWGVGAQHMKPNRNPKQPQHKEERVRMANTRRPVCLNKMRSQEGVACARIQPSADGHSRMICTCGTLREKYATEE